MGFGVLSIGSVDIAALANNWSWCDSDFYSAHAHCTLSGTSKQIQVTVSVNKLLTPETKTQQWFPL